MTFSMFAKILKVFYSKETTNGTFVLNLFDESLEGVSKEAENFVLEKNGFLSYNPIRSEETARKYFDGSRKISRQNFNAIAKYFERNKFIEFLENYILKTDDNFRHLVLKLKECGIECDENNVQEKCADIFDAIIASADKEYKKTSELNIINNAEQEQFKNYIFTLFQSIVEKENWPFSSRNYKIYKDEIYELCQEDCDERFDIAVENFNGENSIPSIKLLIKCKKANAPLTKDELVLFRNKVNQVTGTCKALFVTNSSVEGSALRYAQITGIGILRVFDKEKTEWFAPRKMDECTTFIEIEKTEQEIQKAILEPDYIILNNFLVGFFEKYYGSVSSLFNKIFTGNDHSHINNAELFLNKNMSFETDSIKFISNEKLKQIGDSIRFEIYGTNARNILKVDIKDLIFYLKNKFDFAVKFPQEEINYTFPEKIRGLVDYKNRTVFIYGINSVDLHLLKFSIAHEISHLILHKPLLERGKDKFFYFYESTKESQRMEAQANKLANYIILNDESFQKEFRNLAAKYYLNVSRGYYLYLDSQPCNIQQYTQITNTLIKIFDVSREQIKIRLIELGWLRLPEEKSFNFFNRMIV